MKTEQRQRKRVLARRLAREISSEGLRYQRASAARFRVISLIVAVALANLGARAEPQPSALRLVQRISLPAASSIATDIRWAGEGSVYVSWHYDGVTEIDLDGTAHRIAVPNLKTRMMRAQYSHVAVSPKYFAVAGQFWSLAWRLRQAPSGERAVFFGKETPITNDLDVAGDRLLLLGIPQREKGYSANGDIAWVGSFPKALRDLKPVLRDVGGAGAPNFFNCGTYSLGAVRFLADGSFVVAPGFQDGIHLFDARGRQVRSWTGEQVGLDTAADCAKMTKEDEARYRANGPYWRRWLNQHHVLDDILPLPQGPGLLVRSWEGQAAHWTLKVLTPAGVKTFSVPLVGRRPFDRLHGDVRNGRIILLLSASGYPFSKSEADLPAEIFLMETPNA